MPKSNFNLKISAVLIVASFFVGFKTNEFISFNTTPRATGLGGVFFKSKNPQELKKWYAENLKLNINTYGAVFEWYQGGDSTQKGFLQWSPFKESTTYFKPSNKEFMINYRVIGLDQLLERFKNNGVTVLDTIQRYEYGNFLHVMDPEGNKVELWEPNDQAYEKMGKDMQLKTTF